MKPIAWFLAPCAALLAGWGALSGASSAAPAASAACDIWVHEPLVAYDIQGTTFAGPFDETLLVYNDGVVKHFSLSQGKAAVVYLSPTLTRQLAKDLFLAGAFTLCDAPEAGADIPMQTLTLFRGKADALTHSVNWWNDDPPYGAVRQILDDFIAANVP